MPQQKILERDEVRVFLNHGGWNSINEGIFHSKPMVIVPGFPDQEMNALVLEKNKAAVVLNVTRRGKASYFLPSEFNKIELTSDDVRKSIRKAMADNSYKTNIEKLSKISATMNGFEIYKSTIDMALESGYNHLIDENHAKVSSRKVGDAIGIWAIVGLAFLAYKQSDSISKFFSKS